MAAVQITGFCDRCRRTHSWVIDANGDQENHGQGCWRPGPSPLMPAPAGVTRVPVSPAPTRAHSLSRPPPTPVPSGGVPLYPSLAPRHRYPGRLTLAARRLAGLIRTALRFGRPPPGWPTRVR